MKYIDEFRDRELARKLATTIAQEANPGRDYRLMEFCGGHTHAIFRYGVQDLMPANVRFVHGPGCPVCVLPTARLDQAMAMTERYGLILCTYADLMRVPASNRRSLLKAKAAGADIRMVYSTQDALAIARANPERQVVFFAIGFETTTPPTAVALQQAKAEGMRNFSVFCNHVLTPPAMRAILASASAGEMESGSAPLQDPASPTIAARAGETASPAAGMALDGILGPSHVSTVIGSAPYAFVAAEFGTPLVIAGFEPLDVMQATLMLIRQINAGRAEVENQYLRAVTAEGNRKAQRLMAEVLSLRDRFEWRGLGFLPHSAQGPAPAFADFDAEQRFPVAVPPSCEVKGCECPAVLRGVKEPADCRLFGTACTPDNPMGSCMVSSEGACAAYWSYGRFRARA